MPAWGLTNVGGTLFGTTASGGAAAHGTIFSFTGQGVESVTYSFLGGSDGAEPASTLMDIAGTLIGKTQQGGGSAFRACSHEGCGTVFAFSP
jgi:uncharacterized repeat protein (TIGR03803 family)